MEGIKISVLCVRLSSECSKNIQGLLEEKTWTKKINECVFCVCTCFL